MSLVRPDSPLLMEVQPEYTGEARFLRGQAETLYAAMNGPKRIGIGIAAPQLGLRVRMFVMNLKRPAHRTLANSYVCINPVVLERRGEPVLAEEGCLTVPGDFYPVSRHEEIRAEWTDLSGQRRRETLYALAARCFQHELDHLDGITLWNREAGTA